MEIIKLLDKNIIRQILDDIDNKDYVNYQNLVGGYDYSLFKLIVEHIPKDPFAPPHSGLYRLQVQRNDERIINFDTRSKIQTIAFADYLARVFYDACEKISKGLNGTGYSGLITINKPGQAILERSNVVVSDDVIELRCFLGMPGNKRIITSSIAEQMLMTELPAIVEASLLKENIDYTALKKHIETAEDSEYLRNKLDSLGLVAFIANDSILPRESGMSDLPMSKTKAISFTSPETLSIEIDVPNKGCVKGLAIEKGVSLIVGGGYHGKSTLLNTLERGIYNHIPGDGREYCVSSMQMTKVRAYSGRRVVKTDISTFINNLPFNQNTTSFSTENASGSTSQAVSIMEAMEIGAETLLMDEDTCATNFMIRDHKMQQLVNENDEPITTFIDKVKQLYIDKNISTILVLGGVGDYFDVSDRVIQMINYQAFDMTTMAHKISACAKTKRVIDNKNIPILFHQRIPLAESIVSINKYGKFSIYAQDVHHLNFGNDIIDLTDVEQLVELSQTKALGYAIEYAKKYMDNTMTLNEVVKRVLSDIEEQGVDIISDNISGHFSCFRGFELAFAINRLKGLEVMQKEL